MGRINNSYKISRNKPNIHLTLEPNQTNMVKLTSIILIIIVAFIHIMPKLDFGILNRMFSFSFSFQDSRVLSYLMGFLLLMSV